MKPLGAQNLDNACAAVQELAQLADDASGAQDLQAAYDRIVATQGGASASGLAAHIDAKTAFIWRALSTLATKSDSKLFAPGSNKGQGASRKNGTARRAGFRAEGHCRCLDDTPGALSAFKRFCQYPPLDLGPDNHRLLEALRAPPGYCLRAAQCAVRQPRCVRFSTHRPAGVELTWR